MPTVRGCHLPDDLYYDVDNHIWFRERDDGTVQLGMTTVATAMAGQLVAFDGKPRRVRAVDVERKEPRRLRDVSHHRRGARTLRRARCPILLDY